MINQVCAQCIGLVQSLPDVEVSCSASTLIKTKKNNQNRPKFIYFNALQLYKWDRLETDLKVSSLQITEIFSPRNNLNGISSSIVGAMQ